MDKFINSPVKKPKQTSLSDFYRKPQYQDRQQSNLQSPSTISLTPSKLKANDHDSSKFAGKIASPLINSRAYHPLISNDEYKTLDINSNMKLKMDDMFIAQHEGINKPSKANIMIQQPVYQQNMFAKPFQSNLTKNQQLGYSHQPATSQLITKKFDNSYSDLDLNLSVQPQEIKLPQVKRHQKIINQFRLHDYDDRLDSNFLITPQNSLIKSPQKYLPLETNHFTPLQSDKYDDRQPPSSEIIQRLRFNNQHQEITTDKKQQYQLRHQEKCPKKVIANSQPFDKHLQLSPVSGKKHINKIPSPRKSPSKRSPSITDQSPKKSINSNKNQAKQVLSSDDEDASQLLSKIRQLQTQVSTLKTHKYQFAISKYRQQIRYQLQKQLQKSIIQINSQYDTKQQQLKKQAESQKQIYTKSIQDIAKYKKTYAIIFGQLKENREKIQDEYKEKVEQVKKYKERLIHDWKRKSNEEIKKIINNSHAKHSIRLNGSKEKGRDQSKEKVLGLMMKDKLLTGNISKK